ncbi:MAG: DNA polymerase III subunit delta [Candidatus Magasanikbacteria bacterium]|jgi:DNA polymerase III subunit delta|nr:DNA polymerase III subunit delta [Candidatus Magasanikbacteria bacterium]
MIICVYGKDSYRGSVQLRKMVEKFSLQRDPQGLNLVQLQGKGLAYSTFAQEVCASPFLAEKRMVVVKGLIEDGSDDLIGSVQTLFEKGVPDTTVLICFEQKDTFKKKIQKTLFASLCEQKYAQRFDMLSGSALQGYIGAEIIEKGGAIQKAAVFTLSRLFAEDMWGLHNSIEQLVAYARGREITNEDVLTFCEEQAQDNIFALVDAILGKNKKQMVQLLEQQYKQGKDALYVFAMVLRQFRIHLQLRDCVDANITPDAKAMGLHPYVVKKTLPSVRQYSMDRLTGIYKDLLIVDTRIKTGVLPANIAVERLLAQCVA